MGDREEEVYEAGKAAHLERRIHERRGLRWALCVVGIHKMTPVLELRPWTSTNPQSAFTVECARCGRLEESC